MKPTAILTADLEWRGDVPVCRTDDFLSEQLRKWKWLKALQRKWLCPILDSGDVFNSWKSPPWLEVQALSNTPDCFFTIPGNHDLPGHNLQNFEKSSLAVLDAGGKAKVLTYGAHSTDFAVLYPFPWGTTPKPNSDQPDRLPTVAMCHIMTYTGKTPWPGCEDTEAAKLLKMMKGYNLVLTGHNHKPFVIYEAASIEFPNGRLLVNPGSLMRTTADQIDFKPRVYLWYAESNTVEPVFVPISEGVVSREHLEKKEDRDKRMDSFIDTLSGDYELSSRFETNLESFFANNRVRASVKEIIMESIK